MQIIHVYNNNIVSAIRGKQEMIIVGAGIGFHKRPGDTVDEKRIEKTYTFEDEQKKQLHMLLERTPILYFRIAEVIARKACETLKIEVSPQLLISLSDHIHYAAERKKQNINVPNFMLNEIKTLYKREFKVGLWALKLIQANTEISFPEDEAGYIAMHIVNATLNNGGRSSNVSKILRFIKDVQRIVEETYQVHLDENELNFSRFITHLKFLGSIHTQETYRSTAYVFKSKDEKRRAWRFVCLFDKTQ